MPGILGSGPTSWIRNPKKKKKRPWLFLMSTRILFSYQKFVEFFQNNYQNNSRIYSRKTHLFPIFSWWVDHTVACSLCKGLYNRPERKWVCWYSLGGSWGRPKWALDTSVRVLLGEAKLSACSPWLGFSWERPNWVLAHLGWGSLGGGQSKRLTPWLGFSWERLEWVFGELRAALGGGHCSS